MTAALLGGMVRRLAVIGVAETDSEPLRAQKSSLTVAAMSVIALATIWVATYFALGLAAAAAIPLIYQVTSVASLIVFARTKSYPFFRTSQAAMMTALPFVLQWTLGGYVASSAVSLWAFVAAIGTLFFFSVTGSIPWFTAFVVLTLVSGLLEPSLAQNAAPIPDYLQTAFFVLNIAGVSMTAYVLLQYAVRARDTAYARSERLLLNVLPRPIADRLRREPGVIADAHAEVSVLFADVVDFTPLTERTEPSRVVGVLDALFTMFDSLAADAGLEKIKTIGDAYMLASGLPEPRTDHAEAAADIALAMQRESERIGVDLGVPLALRIGIDSGPVIAGVIGRHKFSYDLWGDTVNTASRMESHGIPGRIQVSESTYRRLSSRYRFEPRGEIAIKGKGQVRAYLLVGA